MLALLRTDRRSRISRRNWSGGTKNGFSCSTPPIITTGCVRMTSITTASAKFRQIVRADHRIVVLGNHVVDACLVFAARSSTPGLSTQRPFHMRQKPGERSSLLLRPIGALLRSRPAWRPGRSDLAELSVLPTPHLQLARTHCLLHIDACFSEPLQMIFPSARGPRCGKPLSPGRSRL